MKVVSEAAARGPVDAVWDALHDAAILARAIPGCEQFEVDGPGSGQFVATTALPAVSGTYAGKLTIAEQHRPSLLRVTASMTGDQGTVTADVALRLSDTGDATTLVSYEANGTVTGPAAAVGTRLLTSAAKRLASEFFVVIDESVAEQAAGHAAEHAAAVRPERLASDVVRPRASARPWPAADNRSALVAGAAIGLAGVIIGVLAGRRGGRAGRVRA